MFGVRQYVTNRYIILDFSSFLKPRLHRRQVSAALIIPTSTKFKWILTISPYLAAHITGFEDVDSTIQSSLDVKDNGDLEQLKQRLPWNQLSSNETVNTSESPQVSQNSFVQPTNVQTSIPQSKAVSGITVSQISRSQPQRLLHISGVQMHQQQGNQILQIPSLTPTQSSQTQSGPSVSTIPSSMLPTSTMQMLTPSSTMSQTAVTISNSPQSQSLGLTQFLHSTSQGVTNQLTTLSNSNQTQNKVQFVQQQLLIPGQQSNQGNSMLHQQQQALILQKRTVPHQQQRILLQQQLITQGGVTTAHWRPSNIVS